VPYSFIYPSIIHLPPGYDCTIALPFQRIADRMIGGDGVLIARFQVFYEGNVHAKFEDKLTFRGGHLEGSPPEPFVWRDADKAWGGNSGYLELSLDTLDERPLLRSKAAVGFYSIYSKPGKKSFFADNAYKYGSPPVIGQIAAFGRFVDGYPVVHLDRVRDFGHSIVLINPYKKSVSARIFAHDGRSLPPVKVPSISVRVVRLVELLRPDESSWVGHIQLTAKSRLVTFAVMHSLRDSRMISDHEHLDPFRSDPTHLPVFQLLRQRVGKYLMYRGSS